MKTEVDKLLGTQGEFNFFLIFWSAELKKEKIMPKRERDLNFLFYYFLNSKFCNSSRNINNNIWHFLHSLSIDKSQSNV